MPIRKKIDIQLEYTQLDKCDFLLISGRKNKISGRKCNHLVTTWSTVLVYCVLCVMFVNVLFVVFISVFVCSVL